MLINVLVSFCSCEEAFSSVFSHILIVEMPKHPPFIHFLYLLLPILGRRGLLEPIPAVKGRETGSTLDRSPAYCGANTQRQTFNLINTYGQFRLRSMSLMVGGPTHAQGKHFLSHRKVRPGI